jgi:hypothetical protein
MAAGRVKKPFREATNITPAATESAMDGHFSGVSGETVPPVCQIIRPERFKRAIVPRVWEFAVLPRPAPPAAETASLKYCEPLSATDRRWVHAVAMRLLSAARADGSILPGTPFQPL